MKLKRPVLTVVVAGILLLIAVIVIWRMSIASANKDRLRAIAARGEPVDLVALDKFYADAPDSSNAALIWLKGAAAITADPGNQLNNLSIKWQTSLSADQIEAGTNMLLANKEALALFRSAAALPLSRYPVGLSQYPVTNFQHLADVKGVAQLLRLQAVVTAQQGDNAKATDAITQIFAAGRSLETEPLLISQLVRFAINTIGVSSLQFALNRRSFADSELATMQAVVAQADNTNGLRFALLGERASFVTFLRDPQKAVAADPTIAPSGSQDTLAEVFLWPMARAVGFWQRDLRFGIDALTTNIVFASLPSPQRFYSATNAEAIADRAQSGKYILTALLLPALQKAVERDALHSAHVRNSVAALAIERFQIANDGRLPETAFALLPAYLKELPVDPYDGKPVRYKRTDKGYVVYCIGRDVKDNGGTEKVPNAPKGAPEDVTFIVERTENR